MTRPLAGVLIERQDGTQFVVLERAGGIEVYRIEPPAPQAVSAPAPVIPATDLEAA